MILTYISSSALPEPKPPTPPPNPCVPSPCGPYSECHVIGSQASCRCRDNYVGVPPQCRPECVVNTDCSPPLACISEKCRDPCPGSCGLNAKCTVQNHIPICSCLPDYTGDPFTQCTIIIAGECTNILLVILTHEICWFISTKNLIFFSSTTT